MKLLMVYNFVDEEQHVTAPNFYRECAEKVFPAEGIETDLLPDLRGAFLFKLLLSLRLRDDRVMMIVVFWWLLRHGRQYDVIVGWLTNGMLAALLKHLPGWSRVAVCLILYKLPKSDGRGPKGMIKRRLLGLVSSGADLLLALDLLQSIEFGKKLGRTLGTTLPLRYGVHANWYAEQSITANTTPTVSIFVPGGACRDDGTVEKAVQDLGVCLKRFQVHPDKDRKAEKSELGRAIILKRFNAPYDDYMSECVSSDIVVISVENGDKPVGLTSLLECMALGRPVIMTNGMSSSDYVVDGETALLFNEGDWQGLRDKIQFLLDNPAKAQELGRAAKNMANTGLGLQSCGVDFARMLQSLRSE